MKPKLIVAHPDVIPLQRDDATLADCQRTLDLVRGLLAKIDSKLAFNTARQRKLVTIPDGVDLARSIIVAVAEHFDFSVGSILGPGKHQGLCWARQMAMALTRELTELSTTEIAHVFNRKDHGSVIYSVQVFKDRLSVDPKAAALAESFRARFLALQTAPLALSAL